MPSDPIRDFEHDHAHVNALVSKIRELLAAAEARATPSAEQNQGLARAFDELRDALLAHFAREEEALFPFIARQLPEFADAVERLQLSHDALCGTVLRISYLATASRGADTAPLIRILELFDRFDAAYEIHARDESDLLSAVSAHLDPHQRRELAGLIEGL
ncbi:MAG: hemerythrin domain-containing protein [Polyangiaceae bacterium]